MIDEATKALRAAMAKAFPQIEGAIKGRSNDHFRSKYADLAAVVDAIKPALADHGLWFAQLTHEQEGGVCVETVVYHEAGGEQSFGRLFVPASKHDAQGYGSALTYARRYSLMTAFGVPAEDDDGNAAAASAPRRQQADPLESKAATDMLARLRNAAMEGEEALQAAFQAEPKGALKNAVWKAHSAALKEAASQVAA